MYRYFIILLLFSTFIFPQKSSAQFVFNDTIMVFNLLKIRKLNNGDARYLIDYATASGLTGKMVLSLCYCYCDSLWDAWPDEVVGGGMTGGEATLTYIASSSSGSGQPNLSGDLRRRGRLNIWKMPGPAGIPRSTPFELPVVFMVDP